jgi:hypothetical protein
LVGLFICGYEVSQLKRTLAKQSTGVPIVSGGPVGDSALEKANTWSVRQGPIASSSTAPESTVLSGDLTDNKPNQAVIVSRSGTAGAIDFGPTPGDGHQHNLQVSVSASCWLRVTEQTPAAKVLIDGFQKNGFMQTIEFDEGASLEVRSGCPGDVHYTVNGLIVHPDNVSGTPDKSEVVELRL